MNMLVAITKFVIGWTLMIFPLALFVAVIKKKEKETDYDCAVQAVSLTLWLTISATGLFMLVWWLIQSTRTN